MPFLERHLYINNITNFLNFRIMENVERIYCCDRGDNDNALTAAIMANNNRRDDLGPMLAMNGGMNNWMNNPFAYLMFLALFRNGGFGFGGDGAGTATQGIETQAQLNAIRTQLQDTSNADCIKSAIQGNGFALSQLAQNLNVDFNTLQKSCCDVQAAIQQVAGQVGFSAERVINAVNLGDCNVIQALQNCCCQTQRQIADFRADVQLQGCKNTSELLRGQDFINRSVERGFSSVAFQAQQDKCDIIRAGQDNTQRIIDTLNGHWSDEKSLQIQDLKFQLSQERQNNLLLNRLGGNGCGCGNSYGCGCGQ
nr:MAG TPA: hypothetical protein [Caudoviricetes sp.]